MAARDSPRGPMSPATFSSGAGPHGSPVGLLNGASGASEDEKDRSAVLASASSPSSASAAGGAAPAGDGKRPSAMSQFSPEKQREIWGWIWYDWANSVYVIATNLFIPKFLTELGEDLGWESPKSFWSFASVVATILSLVAYVIVSPIADHGIQKLGILWWTTVISCVTTMLCLVIVIPDLIWLAGVLFVIGRVAERVGGIPYSAMLQDVVDMNEAAAHEVSARGVTLGYLSMLVFFLLIGGAFLAPVQFGDLSSYWLEYQLPIFAAGLWWLVHCLILVFPRMKHHPGPPLPKEAGDTFGSLFRFALTEGLCEQWAALRQAWEMRDLFYFLLAWVFLSDASSTATGSATLLAEELGFGTLETGALAAVGLLFAGLGVIAFSWFVNRGKIRALTVLRVNIVILTFCASWISWQSEKWEVYAIAVIGGFNIGTINCFTRSTLSLMIPHSFQARLFSLHELTQKGTSWIGPLIIGALNSALGESNYRYIVVAIVLVEVVIGFPFFFLVDPVRGQRLAEKMNAEDAAAAAAARAEGGTTAADRLKVRIVRPTRRDSQGPQIMRNFNAAAAGGSGGSGDIRRLGASSSRLGVAGNPAVVGAAKPGTHTGGFPPGVRLIQSSTPTGGATVVRSPLWEASNGHAHPPGR